MWITQALWYEFVGVSYRIFFFFQMEKSNTRKVIKKFRAPAENWTQDPPSFRSDALRDQSLFIAWGGGGGGGFLGGITWVLGEQKWWSVVTENLKGGDHWKLWKDSGRDHSNWLGKWKHEVGHVSSNPTKFNHPRTNWGFRSL